jgi:dienelactone hydrolase
LKRAARGGINLSGEKDEEIMQEGKESQTTRPNATKRRSVITGFVLIGLGVLCYSMRTNPLATVLWQIVWIGLAATIIAFGILTLAAWSSLRLHSWDLIDKLGIALLAFGAIMVGLFVNSLFLQYDREDVTFRNGKVSLGGTLYKPRSAGPHPAVIIIHGSGRETRKEYAFYAKQFAKNGIVGLVYDKRGTGLSTGDTYEVGYEGYASDALAGIMFLRERQDIVPDQIGAMGHSEGASWVGPLLSSQYDDLAFLILQSGGPVSPAVQVVAEVEVRLRRKGYSNEIINRATSLYREVLEYERTGREKERVEAMLRETRGENWFNDSEDLPDTLYPIEEYRWWRSVMDFDPKPFVRRMDIPVLVILGERDDRFPAEESKRIYERLFAESGNTSATIAVFPRAEHALIEWWLPKRMPPPRYPDGYLELLSSWPHRVLGSSD